VFWQGEFRYTREDLAFATHKPQKKDAEQNQSIKPPAGKTPEKQSKAKFSRSMLGWVLILATAILLFVLFHQPTPTPPVAPPPKQVDHSGLILGCSSAAAIAWLVAIGKFVPALEWRRIKDRFTRPRQIAIGSGGIVTRDAETHIWHAWGTIVDVEDYPDGIILISAEEWRLVIPLRGMPPEQRQALADFARAHMGGKALGFEVIPKTEPAA